MSCLCTKGVSILSSTIIMIKGCWSRDPYKPQATLCLLENCKFNLLERKKRSKWGVGFRDWSESAVYGGLFMVLDLRQFANSFRSHILLRKFEAECEGLS